MVLVISTLPLHLILLATLVGALMGCVTGLVPGLHSNNVATFIGANPGFLLGFAFLGMTANEGDVEAIAASCLVVSCAVSHTVANIIPSVFLAIPDEDTALSVLPGHRMVRAGRGGEAVRISVMSSLASLAIALTIILPVCHLMGPPVNLYQMMAPFIAPLLCGVSILMVLREAGKRGKPGALGGWRAALVALVILLASGAIGHMALFQLGLVAPLFIGLFGIPVLLFAMGSGIDRTLPVHTDEREVTLPPWGPVIKGSLAGSLVGWFPGVSAAQATILAIPGEETPADDVDGARRFIAAVSAVNTANALFTLVALAALLRVRSGAMGTVSALMAWDVAPWSGGLPGLDVALLILSATVGGVVAAPFTLIVSSQVQRMLPYLSDPRVMFFILSFLVSVCIWAGGWNAGLVLLAASGLGMVPPLLGLMRVHLMGAVTLPLVLGSMMG